LIIFLTNHISTPSIYPLSLHDALPIFDIAGEQLGVMCVVCAGVELICDEKVGRAVVGRRLRCRGGKRARGEEEHDHVSGNAAIRSEEHTSELQSRSDLVCRLLLEKKKQ